MKFCKVVYLCHKIVVTVATVAGQSTITVVAATAVVPNVGAANLATAEAVADGASVVATVFLQLLRLPLSAWLL